MCYFALSFGISSLPGDIYLNNLISAGAEAIGYAGCFCIAWWGRKWPTVASFYFAGGALLISVMITVYKPGQRHLLYCKGFTIFEFCLLVKNCGMLLTILNQFNKKIPFIADAPFASTIMSMVGKMFIVAAWQMIIVWSGEIFPTTYRCMLSAMIALAGRIGSVVAPVFLDLVSWCSFIH